MPAASSVVVDASVALRAIVDENPEALDWFRRIDDGDVYAVWPQLAYAEIANGLATLVRASRITSRAAVAGLAYAVASAVEAEGLDILVEPALAMALARSVSAYDACYIVLAEAGSATLLTADRRLAAATDHALLLAG